MNDSQPNSPMSVIEALNRVQSWLNAGEFDKVIQGCQEILQIEPGNARALALLRQAEERRFQQESGSSQVVAPLEELEVEERTPTPSPSPSPSPQMEKDEEREEMDLYPNKTQLFMAMLLPAVFVVLLGGGALIFLTRTSQEEVVNNEQDEEVEVAQDQEYLQRNDERKETLEKMQNILEDYYQEEGFYPTVKQVDDVLMDSDEFDELPVDPRNGDSDKAGREFGYIYAVYDENSDYILSALFEDGRGFGHPWTGGRSAQAHPNYRDLEEKDITLIE